ncbi:uncharacterized protein LOC110983938 [Acanthaster planci]|uniref:Uncharacterized protein LOC110983938 n=1 Tax=Acanthaster planci TaxID=133434 RepID=A0A8B7Z153_ACAPL|nr:uncharacterized protein LOC110983938 [Acanthaster planci]
MLLPSQVLAKQINNCYGSRNSVYGFAAPMPNSSAKNIEVHVCLGVGGATKTESASLNGHICHAGAIAMEMKSSPSLISKLRCAQFSVSRRNASTSSRHLRSTAAGDWLPRHVDVIPNDSQVRIKFDVAEPEKRIDRYRVFLKRERTLVTYTDVYHNSRNVVRGENDGEYIGWVEFVGLNPGNYCVQILAKPTTPSVCHTSEVRSCKITPCHDFSIPPATTHIPVRTTEASVTSTPSPTCCPTKIRTGAGTDVSLQQNNTGSWRISIAVSMVVCVTVLFFIYCTLCFYKRRRSKRRNDIICNDVLGDAPNTMNNETLLPDSSCHQHSGFGGQFLKDIPQAIRIQDGRFAEFTRTRTQWGQGTHRGQELRVEQADCPLASDQARAWPVSTQQSHKVGFAQHPLIGDVADEVDGATKSQGEPEWVARHYQESDIFQAGGMNEYTSVERAVGIKVIPSESIWNPRRPAIGLRGVSHLNKSGAMSGDATGANGWFSGAIHTQGRPMLHKMSQSNLDLYKLLAPSRYSIASSQFTETWNTFNSIQPADVSTSVRTSSSCQRRDLLVKSCPSIVGVLGIYPAEDGCDGGSRVTNVAHLTDESDGSYTQSNSPD